MLSREKQGFYYAGGVLEPIAPLSLPCGALLKGVRDDPSIMAHARPTTKLAIRHTTRNTTREAHNRLCLMTHHPWSTEYRNPTWQMHRTRGDGTYKLSPASWDALNNYDKQHPYRSASLRVLKPLRRHAPVPRPHISCSIRDSGVPDRRLAFANIFSSRWPWSIVRTR